MHCSTRGGGASQLVLPAGGTQSISISNSQTSVLGGSLGGKLGSSLGNCEGDVLKSSPDDVFVSVEGELLGDALTNPVGTSLSANAIGSADGRNEGDSVLEEEVGSPLNVNKVGTIVTEESVGSKVTVVVDGVGS